MKNKLGTILILANSFLLVQVSHAQKYSISLNGQGTLYMDKANPITITATNAKCSDITATVDNGTLSYENCLFTFTPDHFGLVKFSISLNTKNGVQKLGDTLLSINQSACHPVAYLTGAAHGEIPLKKLLNAKGLKVGYLDCNWKANDCYITSYTLYALHKSEILCMHSFSGNNPEFDSATIDMFGKLQQNDSIYFKHIQVMDGNNRYRKLGDLTVKITHEPEEKEPEEETGTITTIVSRKIKFTNPSQKSNTSNSKDSLLAEILVNKVIAGKIKAYPATNYASPTPLTKPEINEIFSPQTDTVKEEGANSSIVTKIIQHTFGYGRVNSFKILEKWKHNRQTGKTDITILCIAPLEDIIDDDGSNIGYKPIFWLDYNDVKDELMRIGNKYPAQNFDTRIWGGYKEIAED